MGLISTIASVLVFPLRPMNDISRVEPDKKPGKVAENVCRFAVRHMLLSGLLALSLRAAAGRGLPALGLLEKWNHAQIGTSLAVYGIFAFNFYHSSNDSRFLHSTLSAAGIVLLTSGVGAVSAAIATRICSRLKIQNGSTHVASRSWQPLLACFVTTALISRYISSQLSTSVAQRKP